MFQIHFIWSEQDSKVAVILTLSPMADCIDQMIVWRVYLTGKSKNLLEEIYSSKSMYN